MITSFKLSLSFIVLTIALTGSAALGDTTDYSVVKSTTVARTYALLSEVGSLIRARRFDDAIMRLDAQAEAVRTLLRRESDPLVADDLALLESYKRQVLDLKRNPNRGSIILEELSGRSR